MLSEMCQVIGKASRRATYSTAMSIICGSGSFQSLIPNKCRVDRLGDSKPTEGPVTHSAVEVERSRLNLELKDALRPSKSASI